MDTSTDPPLIQWGPDPAPPILFRPTAMKPEVEFPGEVWVEPGSTETVESDSPVLLLRPRADLGCPGSRLTIPRVFGRKTYPSTAARSSYPAQTPKSYRCRTSVSLPVYAILFEIFTIRASPTADPPETGPQSRINHSESVVSVDRSVTDLAASHSISRGRLKTSR